MADELVERINAEIAEQRETRGNILDYGEPDPLLIDARARIQSDAAEIARLRARLEIPEPPFDSEQCDGVACRDETIRQQDEQIARLRAEVATVQRAAKTIMIHEADELRRLRDERVKWHQAITSLDSERQANALLTDRVEALEAEVEAARAKALEEAAKVADDLGGGRVERNPDGSLRTYDMNCKHDRGSATLNAMRVRAQTIAQAIRALSDAQSHSPPPPPVV